MLAGIRFVSTQGVENIGRYERSLIQRLGKLLAKVEGVRLYRSEDPKRQTGVLSFCLDGIDCERVGEWLGDRGIAVRAGLHCAPSIHRWLGTLRSGAVRASIGIYNTEQEIDDFSLILKRILAAR